MFPLESKNYLTLIFRGDVVLNRLANSFLFLQFADNYSEYIRLVYDAMYN